MGSRRTLILVAAIAIGAVAAFLVWGYVGGIQDRAYGNAEKVKVFVVKTAVAKGTYGEEASGQKLIVEDEIPKKFFPPNAIRSLDTDLGGKVAVNNLAVNQIVTTDMFADPVDVQTTFADRLKQIRGVDQTAISISVDTVRGVAGLLQPGDYVNVLSVPPCQESANSGAATDNPEVDPAATSETKVSDNGACKEASDSFGAHARYIYQKVQILAIDQTPVAQPGEVQAASAGEGQAATENRGMITFIVPAKAAQYLASIDPSTIYLTLVPRDYEPVPQTDIDLGAPLPAEEGQALTPYGPDGAGE